MAGKGGPGTPHEAFADAAGGKRNGVAGRDAVPCRSPALARRDFLAAAAAAGLGLPLAPSALAGDDPKNARPQSGDVFVFASGDKAGTVVTPDDLPVGGPPALAWPMDPAAKIVRDGSRLNEVLLVRLDPASFDETTREKAADGVLAYSAICTHAQCPIAGWKEDKQIFHCACHNSEFDPRQVGKVVFGPAPRPLPALPLTMSNGTLTAAGTFIGKVGLRPA